MPVMFTLLFSYLENSIVYELCWNDGLLMQLENVKEILDITMKQLKKLVTNINYDFNRPITDWY